MFCDASLFQSLLPFVGLVIAFTIGLGIGIAVKGP